MQSCITSDEHNLWRRCEQLLKNKLLQCGLALRCSICQKNFKLLLTIRSTQCNRMLKYDFMNYINLCVSLHADYLLAEVTLMKLATAISVICNMCSTIVSLSVIRCCITHIITGFSENCYQPELSPYYMLRKLILGFDCQLPWCALGHWLSSEGSVGPHRIPVYDYR
jgi:hypothetical protein